SLGRIVSNVENGFLELRLFEVPKREDLLWLNGAFVMVQNFTYRRLGNTSATASPVRQVVDHIPRQFGSAITGFNGIGATARIETRVVCRGSRAEFPPLRTHQRIGRGGIFEIVEVGGALTVDHVGGARQQLRNFA